MSQSRSAIIAGVLLLCSSATAYARSSDRRQPMDVEGASFDTSLNDNGVTVFTGNVTIRQGSLMIQADRAEISRAGGNPSRAVLSGRPVRLTEQLDDGTPMNATSARVDYDLRTEIVVFTGGVNLQQPRGNLSGDRVTYNMKSGQVASGGAAGGGRVKMRIMPKNAGTP
ncbi:lipopolysaccharide transport periplasmic protein LptA [Cognatilysobacter lacus]|nr:lipopolysaccharide transport periplasmic protein LptA [Lysobacter lacus]